MPVLSRSTSATFVALVLVAAALVGGTQSASSETCQNWQPQPKNPTPGDAELFGVETISPCNTIAVGYATNVSTGLRQTLIEVWTGHHWITSSISNSGDVTTGAIAGGSLNDLAAATKDNMWAVGQRTLPGQPPESLFVQWNGNKWLRYQTPLDDPIWESEIKGVTAVSKKAYWAVGNYFDNSEEEHRAAIFFWNGSKKKWTPSKIQLPQSLEGVDITLNAVTGLPGEPAWAVGSFAGIGGRRRVLILKWNNQVWKPLEHLPNVDFSNNVLLGVNARGGNVWASGYWEPTSNPDEVHPLILKKSGSQFKRSTVFATKDGDETPVTDVIVIPGGTWAAGYSTCLADCDPDKTSPLILKYDSRESQQVWNAEPSLSLGVDNRIYEIDASSHRNVWVVGSYRETAEGPLRTYAFKGGFCC